MASHQDSTNRPLDGLLLAQHWWVTRWQCRSQSLTRRALPSGDDLIQHATGFVPLRASMAPHLPADYMWIGLTQTHHFFFPIWEGSFSLLECWNSINHFSQPLPPPLLNIEPKGLQTPSTYSPAKPHPSHCFIKKVLRFYDGYLFKTKPVKFQYGEGRGP